VNFLIADTVTDSLTRLTGDEQKAVKTTAFDLRRPESCIDRNEPPEMTLHPFRGLPRPFRSARRLSRSAARRRGGRLAKQGAVAAGARHVAQDASDWNEYLDLSGRATTAACGVEMPAAAARHASDV
jgi:hypothetical protein